MTTASDPSRGIVFTAFEPSGDALAASAIRELKKRRPDLPIHAWGGSKMQDAGANIIEDSVHSSSIGGVTFEQIREHFALRKRFHEWVSRHDIALHVAVDSPAANFPLCKISRKAGCRVAHLAAPQLWAWAPWRIRKLRRLTNLVLCLLPFEQPYFHTRRVPALFIGHPLMAEDLDDEKIAAQAEDLPQGEPRILLLPGSRPNEISRHVQLMLDGFEKFRTSHADAAGVMVAANERVSNLIREAAGAWPDGLTLITGQLQAALRWADFGIVCSGTVTLDAARFHMPMAVIYRLPLLPWYLIGQWIVRPKFFALPNLIAGREIVPEIVPFRGGGERVAQLLEQFVADPEMVERQESSLRTIAADFHEVDPPTIAADQLLSLYDAALATAQS